MRRLLLISVITLIAIAARGQIISPSPSEVIDTDSVRKAFDNSPFFGLYKDNYFIFGPSVGPKATKANTNVKFQISIAQRLTKSVLPWHTYLYLFYTQKCFWNVLQKSFPMTDLNFNPGIGLTKPLFVKNRFIGKVSLILEHESNGKSHKASRSWNRISPRLLRPIPVRHELQHSVKTLRSVNYTYQTQGLEPQLQYRSRTELQALKQRKPISVSTVLQRLRRGAARL